LPELPVAATAIKRPNNADYVHEQDLLLVTDASLVTVIIGASVSLILIVIGSFLKNKIQLCPIGRTSATTSSRPHLSDFDAPPVDRRAEANRHPGEDQMPPCRTSSRASYSEPGRGVASAEAEVRCGEGFERGRLGQGRARSQRRVGRSSPPTGGL
jgi:hypothetical protein